MENQEKKGLKYWLEILKTNTRAFFKNPRQFAKNYIENFKTLDTKGKIKKILLTVLAVFVLQEAFVLFAAIAILLGMINQPISFGAEAAKDVEAETKARERVYAEGGSYYQHYDDIRGSM